MGPEKFLGQTFIAKSSIYVTAPIIAANTLDQLKDILGAVGYRLSPDEMTQLNTVSSYPREWWRSKPE